MIEELVCVHLSTFTTVFKVDNKNIYEVKLQLYLLIVSYIILYYYSLLSTIIVYFMLQVIY